jgi:hypothetical protein
MSPYVRDVISELFNKQSDIRHYNRPIRLPVIWITMLESLDLEKATDILEKTDYCPRSTIQNRLTNKTFPGFLADNMCDFVRE